MTGMPQQLTGLDAELHDALTECGRIIEAMPHDERRDRVDRFLEQRGVLVGLNRQARDFVVGVMIVAHQRRIFDQEWQEHERTQQQAGGTP